MLFPNKLPSADLANVSKREPSPLRNDERVAQSMSPPVNERVPNQNESAPATLAEPGEGGWVGRNQRGNQQMDDKPSNWEQRAQLKPHRAPPARAGRRRHKAHLHRPPIAVHLVIVDTDAREAASPALLDLLGQSLQHVGCTSQ